MDAEQTLDIGSLARRPPNGDTTQEQSPLTLRLRHVLVLFMSIPPAAPGLADRFALIMGGLCRAAAARIAADRSAGPLLILIWGRLRRMTARFASLAARAQAGPLPPPRRRAAGPGAPRTRQRPLPGSFAWLVRLVPEAACFGGQLQHLLSDPEMAALLQAAPQAARILRPLCRMLAIRVDPSVVPPPPKRAARSASAAPEPAETEPARTKPAPTELAPAGPARTGPPGPEPPVQAWGSWCGILMPMRPPSPA